MILKPYTQRLYKRIYLKWLLTNIVGLMLCVSNYCLAETDKLANIVESLKIADQALQGRQISWKIESTLYPRPDAAAIIDKSIDSKLAALSASSGEEKRRDLEIERKYRKDHDTVVRNKSFDLLLSYLSKNVFYAEQQFENSSKKYKTYATPEGCVMVCDYDKTLDIFSDKEKVISDLIRGIPILHHSPFLSSENSRYKLASHESDGCVVLNGINEAGGMSVTFFLSLPELRIKKVQIYRAGKLIEQVETDYDSADIPTKVNIRKFFGGSEKIQEESIWTRQSINNLPSNFSLAMPSVAADYMVTVTTAAGREHFRAGDPREK